MHVDYDDDALYPKPEGVVFKSLWRTGSHRYRSQTVSETDDHIRIEIELPGVSHDHVHIEVLDHAIRVRVDRSGRYESSGRYAGEEDGVYFVDDRYSGFERIYRLPSDFDSDRAKATFIRDTLRIDIPKIVRSKQTIPVA